MVIPPIDRRKNSKIEDMNWLSGKWSSKTENTFIEEIWLHSINDSMLGVFRWFKDNMVFIYEILQIKETNKVIKLQIRHFDGDLNAWEEKKAPLELILVELDEKKAYFRKLKNEEISKDGWIVYELNKNNQLIFTDYKENSSISLQLIFNPI